MKKTILILGASGATAQNFISQFEAINLSDWDLKLLVRNPSKLTNNQLERYPIIVGDASNPKTYLKAITNDVTTIYSNLGDRHVNTFAKALLSAIKTTKNNVKIVWLAGAGIENESTGKVAQISQMDQTILSEQQNAAKMIAQSGITYTILRPVLLNNGPLKPFKIYQSNVKIPEQFVSRKTVAKIALDASTTTQFNNQSIGIVNP